MSATAKKIVLPVSEAVEAEHNRAIESITETVLALNDAIRHAVESGLSVEIARASRFHDGSGNWGDQMTLTIMRLHDEQ